MMAPRDGAIVLDANDQDAAVRVRERGDDFGDVVADLIRRPRLLGQRRTLASAGAHASFSTSSATHRRASSSANSSAW
jgi:hypothetical protein